MTEFGAAAAGGTVGGASGKAVSTGISTIFGKVNEQTVKAAGKEKEAPSPKPAPPGGAARGSAGSVDTFVPPPPPSAATRRVVAVGAAENIPQHVPFAPFTVADALPATPIPPPPTMTPESFKQVSMGMSRADVLKLGDPASRLAMFDDGHMMETFSYRAAGERFGRLQLQDGAVVKIEAN